MATIRILEGADTLREMYPKVNENFENLNNESADLQLQITENNQDRIDDLEAHKTSTDHPAQNITYSGKINKNNVKEALDDAKDRIDNIVTSAGTSNTEIVDARQSTVKSKTFANVRARFEESENQVKALENQVYQSQSNSTTLTPLELLKSVTDSYASPAKLTLGGATLYNAIVGGQAVAVGGTKTFMAKNGIKYFDSCNKVFINGTGVNVTITNNTTVAKDIMAIPMTGTPYESYTADQMNALVNTYFEGLKSTNKMEILTRGRNLFDKASRTLGKTLDSSGNETTVATDFTSNFIRVKPSTTYFLSGKTVAKFYAQYDRNKNFISATSNTNGQIVTTANTTFLKISALESNVDAVILGQSTTALNYEQYQGSKAKIQCTDETKFTLAKLPNGVKNEILINDGKWRAIKRVERYVLKAEDVTSLITTPTNLDILSIPQAVLLGLSGIGTANSQGVKVTTSVSIPALGQTSDIAANSWKHYFSSTTSFSILIPKGTYASLAAAQTALAGTVIYYELATPVTIEEKDLYQYGIQVEGLLATNNAYTEFIVNDYDMLGDVGIEYSINLAKAIEELKDGQITEREFRVRQNLINLEFDARIKLLETPTP